MSLETIYTLASALMLAFVAAIWSSEGWANIAIKVAYVVAAFAGAIMVARHLSL